MRNQKQKHLRTIHSPKNTDLQQELKWIEAAKRDREQFAPLYDKYYKSIYLFVHRRVADSAIAGDITSQVFLKAMLNLKKYEFRSVPFSAWLFRIAINEANMYFRQTKREMQLKVGYGEMRKLAEDAEVGTTDTELWWAIEVLNELPDQEAQLIELRFFEGYAFKDIGDIMGMTEANAKMRVYRTLKKVKKIITLKRGQA